MNADGSGRKQFQLPNDGYVRDLEKALSPDGKWLAYFTGSTEKPYNLAIHLFDTEVGTAFSIASLLAKNFPQNLESVVSELHFDNCTNVECKLGIFGLSMMEGIKSIRWSPDSQHLAFAAQIDGSSSDLYIYSTEEKSLRRLTDEVDNIYRIEWSPNGQKILYDTSSEGGRLYLRTTWHIADFQTRNEIQMKDLQKGSPWLILGWGNENVCYIATASEGPIIRIRSIDVTTGKSEEIWPYITENAFIDLEGRIVLSVFPNKDNDNETNIPEGIYRLSLDGTYTKITDSLYSLFKDQDAFHSYFAIDQQNGLLVSISPDGSIMNFERKVSSQIRPRVSPNQENFIV